MYNVHCYDDLIEHTDIMIIDTCFAMSDAFPEFVDEIEMALLSHNKKIVVRYYVMAELHRLMGSEDDDKRSKSTRAFETVCMRRNIFDIDDRTITSEEILKVFADAELLAELTKSRINYRTILFTNDYKLGWDAVHLNMLGSCYGKKVKVYGLDNNGLLHESKTKNVPHTEIQPTIDEVVKANKDTCVKEKSTEKVIEKRKDSNYIVPLFLSNTVSFVLGVVVKKYGERIVRSIIKNAA